MIDTIQVENIVRIVTQEVQIAIDERDNDLNLKLIHNMIVALNAHDIEAHDKYWSKDMIWHGPPGFGDIHGLEG